MFEANEFSVAQLSQCATITLVTLHALLDCKQIMRNLQAGTCNKLPRRLYDQANIHQL